jgi:transketolase
MRQRFYSLAAQALDDNPRAAMVFAEIGVAEMPSSHPRFYNVGIREQLMIGVAAGLALEGMRPVVHTYAPFLVERPYEQLKLDLGHNDLGAVLVSIGGSFDASASGRTHQAPEDVAIVAALPGWTIEIPGHADEVEPAFRRALAHDGRVYIRLELGSNTEAHDGTTLNVLRRGSETAPLVVAVGPMLDATLAATADLDVTLAYLSTVRPFDRAGLRAALGGTDVVLVEPTLAGTSAAEVARALVDRPHRLFALGVENPELHRYGTPDEHRAAQGLDAAGIRAAIDAFAA